MDSSEILISIIIPCWNSSKSIVKAVESITSQIAQNYEIIIIDDASEDGTWQVIKQLSRHNKRIKIFKNLINKGPSAVRNCGIKISRGKYIGFLDSDDYFITGFLKIAVESLRFCKADIVKFGILRQIHYGEAIKIKELSSSSFYSDKKEKIIERAIYLETLPVFGFVTNGFYQSSLLKENQILFEEDLRFAEDFFFNFEVLRKCKSFKFMSEIGYCYNRGSTSSLSSIEIVDYLEIYLRKIDVFYQIGKEQNCSADILPSLQKLLIRTIYSGGVRQYSRSKSFGAVKQVIRDVCQKSEVKQILSHRCKQGPLTFLAILPLLLRFYLIVTILVVLLEIIKRKAKKVFDLL